jgi:hypothetical protein
MTEFHPASEEILDITDNILAALDGETAAVGLYVLTCVISNIIIQTAPSKETALETIVRMSAAIKKNVIDLDDEGICGWNEKNLQ